MIYTRLRRCHSEFDLVPGIVLIQETNIRPINRAQLKEKKAMDTRSNQRMKISKFLRSKSIPNLYLDSKHPWLLDSHSLSVFFFNCVWGGMWHMFMWLQVYMYHTTHGCHNTTWSGQSSMPPYLRRGLFCCVLLPMVDHPTRELLGILPFCLFPIMQ